ncbi:MAG: DUF4145 domain-containing protein [Lachnospiraceae bacterium]|nr:DUF4145 domain-containing protein [Lachnospiraceae bacterium]
MQSKDFPKVRLRGGFSDRNRIKSENTQMQYKDFDDHTRVCIVNLINSIYNAVYHYDYDCKHQLFLKQILSDVYMEKVEFSEHYKYDQNKIFDLINITLLQDEYDSVLTLVEFICQKLSDAAHTDWSTEFNSIFQQEYVGYRFINRIIVPITDENEIKSIEDAMNTQHENINKHLKKAIGLLSDRKNPDYENSIKESISAVEAMCVSIIGKGATLGEALKKLEKNGVVIHPSLKSAFEKLYGYTSDAKGIRHAGNIGGASSTFEEAKFMLVSCSAFINYLIGVLAD